MSTSWTLYHYKAVGFATNGEGITGISPDIVLSKRFRISKVKTNPASDEYFGHDGEYLIYGSFKADSKELITSKPKN